MSERYAETACYNKCCTTGDLLLAVDKLSSIFLGPRFDAHPAYTIAVTATAVLVPCAIPMLLFVTYDLEGDKKSKPNTVCNYFHE